ncbi:hypothetical protein NB722_001368 [Xanthomonas sacchari]|nr:hypothetical protein [Xanthomonas sacchari]
MDVNFLLDKAKKACGVEFDKDLAPRLGVKPTSISNYRKGVSLPDPVVCATLAGLTGEPLAKVLGIVGEARAISSDEKAVWRKLAATAMGVLLFIGAALPHEAKAATINALQESHTIHYAKFYIWPCGGCAGSVSASLVRVLFTWIVPLFDFKGFFSREGHDPGNAWTLFAPVWCQVAATLPRLPLQRAGLGDLGCCVEHLAEAAAENTTRSCPQLHQRLALLGRLACGELQHELALSVYQKPPCCSS